MAKLVEDAMKASVCTNTYCMIWNPNKERVCTGRKVCVNIEEERHLCTSMMWVDSYVHLSVH